MEDIHVNIFSFLPVKDVISCMSSCKMFNTFCQNPLLWQNLFFNNFNILPSTMIWPVEETLERAINSKKYYYDKVKFCFQMEKFAKIIYDSKSKYSQNFTVNDIYNSQCLNFFNYDLSHIPQEFDLLNNLHSFTINTYMSNDEFKNSPMISQIHKLTRYDKYTFCLPSYLGHKNKVIVNLKCECCIPSQISTNLNIIKKIDL